MNIGDPIWPEPQHAITRWRDSVDLYVLAMRHPVNGFTFEAASIEWLNIGR